MKFQKKIWEVGRGGGHGRCEVFVKIQKKNYLEGGSGWGGGGGCDGCDRIIEVFVKIGGVRVDVNRSEVFVKIKKKNIFF